MSGIVEVQRSIRRSLQAPLKTAADAHNPKVPLQWPGVTFDRKGRPFFMAVELGFGPVIIHEIGRNPLFEGSGHVSIVVRTPIDQGEDGNDSLLGIITAAYPYGSSPSFDGVTVFVDKMEHRGYGVDGPWLTGLVAVHWNIYRRT